MKNSNIKENSFEGGVSGTTGTSNYSAGYGTPGGGNTTQDPSHFGAPEVPTSGSAIPVRPDRISSSGDAPVITGYGKDGSTNIVSNPSHFAKGDDSESASTTEPTDAGVVSRKSSSGALISPAAMADKQKAGKPLNPDQSFEPQVNQLFKKKITPSPDEILQGIQYELGNMVQKDKTIAKQTVIKNLKQDPTYYSRLGMLNINDKDMKVDEGYKSTFSKTKTLLDQMIMEKKQRIQVLPPSAEEILKGLWEKRHGFKGK